MAQKTEYACPACKQLGLKSQISVSDRAIVCDANPEHKWVDTDTFLQLKPVMEFKVAPTKFPPQQNHEPVNITVPIGLMGALTQKYGEKAIPTMVSILMQMIEGDIMLVPEVDLDRISSKLGARPVNSSELYGMIYAKLEEITEAKIIAENATADLKAYEGLAVGRVVVNLGDQYQTAVAKAREAGVPLAMWVQASLVNGLENQWF